MLAHSRQIQIIEMRRSQNLRLSFLDQSSDTVLRSNQNKLLKEIGLYLPFNFRNFFLNFEHSDWRASIKQKTSSYILFHNSYSGRQFYSKIVMPLAILICILFAF